MATTLLNRDYPICDWDLKENDSKIYLKATASADLLINAEIWSANSEDRDFRDEQWNSQTLNVKKISEVETQISYPDQGYKAFYMNLKYTDPNGEEYVKSTRMFVANSEQVL